MDGSWGVLPGSLRQGECSVDIPPVFGIVPRQVIGGWGKPWIEREGFVIRHGLLGLVLEIIQHAQEHIWRQQVRVGFEHRLVLLHRLGIRFVLGVEVLPD